MATVLRKPFTNIYANLEENYMFMLTFKYKSLNPEQ